MARTVPGARAEYIANILRDARKILEGIEIKIDEDRWRKVADWLRSKQAKRAGWQAAQHYLELLKECISPYYDDKGGA